MAPSIVPLRAHERLNRGGVRGLARIMALEHRVHLVVGGLLLALPLDQLLDGQTGLGEPLLDPGERQGQGRALSLQPPRKFRNI